MCVCVCYFLSQHVLTRHNLKPCKKKEKKRGCVWRKWVFINRMTAYFRASGAERDMKVKLTNSEILRVKSLE